MNFDGFRAVKKFRQNYDGCRTRKQLSVIPFFLIKQARLVIDMEVQTHASVSLVLSSHRGRHHRVKYLNKIEETIQEHH